MPRFHYQGFQYGQAVKGKIRARDRADANGRLLNRQITVDELRSGDRVRAFSEQELIRFSRGMASLLRAGVPLSEAGDLWAEDLKQGDRWTPIFRSVREGVPLSDAAAASGGFPRYLVAIFRIGEATGTLKTSFEKSADYLTERRAIRQTLISALIYPAIVLVVAAAAMLVLFLYVLPVFEEMYAKFDADMPTITLLLMGGMTFLRATGPWLALGLTGVTLLAWQRIQTPTGRAQFDALLYRIPLFGSFLKSYHQTLFCQSLGHLLEAGLGLLDALEILGPIIPNSGMRASIAQSRGAIARGVSLNQSLRANKVFPPRLLKMVAMAEQSGSLSKTLCDLGDMLKAEIDDKVKAFASIFEPLLIVTLAIVIGFVLVALYLPMFDIVEVLE